MKGFRVWRRNFAVSEIAWIVVAGFVVLYFAVRLMLRYYFPPDR